MPEGQTSGGVKPIAKTEIKDGRGNLLVAFSSEDVKSFWTQLYQKERIEYAMKCRNKEIPLHYRTGKPFPVGISQIIWEIVKLRLRRFYARIRRD